MEEIIAKLPVQKGRDDWHPKNWGQYLQSKDDGSGGIVKNHGLWSWLEGECSYFNYEALVFPKKDGTFLAIGMLTTGCDGEAVSGMESFAYDAQSKSLTNCEFPLKSPSFDDFYCDQLLVAGIPQQTLNESFKNEQYLYRWHNSADDENGYVDGFTMVYGDMDLYYDYGFEMTACIDYLWDGEQFVKSGSHFFQTPIQCISVEGFAGIKFGQPIPKSIKGYVVEHNNPSPQTECVDYVIKKDGKKVLAITPFFDNEEGGELDKVYSIENYSPLYCDDYFHIGDKVSDIAKRTANWQIKPEIIRTDNGKCAFQMKTDNIFRQYWFTSDGKDATESGAKIEYVRLYVLE